MTMHDVRMQANAAGRFDAIAEQRWLDDGGHMRDEPQRPHEKLRRTPTVVRSFNNRNARDYLKRAAPGRGGRHIRWQ